MEEISLGITILNLIRDIYPVSFISIILCAFGYAMGFIKYRFEIRVIERRIKAIEDMIERTH